MDLAVRVSLPGSTPLTLQLRGTVAPGCLGPDPVFSLSDDYLPMICAHAVDALPPARAMTPVWRRCLLFVNVSRLFAIRPSLPAVYVPGTPSRLLEKLPRISPPCTAHHPAAAAPSLRRRARASSSGRGAATRRPASVHRDPVGGDRSGRAIGSPRP